MAVIGIDKVLKRIEEDHLLENVSHRELNNPEGTGIDLRLAKAFKIVAGGAFIEADGPEGLGMRQGVKAEEVEIGDSQTIEIEPNQYYLVQTMETVNAPLDLLAVPFGRGSLMKAGLQLISSPIAPGYQGPLVFGLHNFSQHTVRLQIGARIAHIIFHEIEGKVIGYRGQHQGGRITIEAEERQV